MSAQPPWPVATRRARANVLALKLVAGMLLSLLSYAGLTEAALGPAAGPVTAPVLHMAAAAPPPGATLRFAGATPIITGSVGKLFEAVGTFVGPNEAMKQDRLRPDVDVLAMTKSFDQARTRIASLANSENTGAIPVPAATVVADSIRPVSPTEVSTQIALAAVAPAATTAPLPPALPPPDGTALAAVDPSVPAAAPPDSAALDAIETASIPTDAIDPRIPVPGTLSQQLAYAREDAPVTVFPDASSKYSAKDLNCLAQAVYFEARGESYRGQVAVAQVVMNRLAHPLYPKSICGVVFQDSWRRDGCQFSFACDGRPEAISEPQPWAQAQEIAQKVASGELYLPEVGNATHYHATYVYPDWAPQLKRVTKIGMHIFYKFRNAA